LGLSACLLKPLLSYLRSPLSPCVVCVCLPFSVQTLRSATVITYCLISLLSLYSRVPSNRSAGPCRAGTTISTIKFHLCVLIPFSSQSWSDSCQSQSSLYNRTILQVRLTLEYCEVNPLTDADFQIHRLLFPPQLSTTLNHTPPPSPIRHVLKRGLTVSPAISRVRPFEPSERLRLPKCLRRFSC